MPSGPALDGFQMPRSDASRSGLPRSAPCALSCLPCLADLIRLRRLHHLLGLQSSALPSHLPRYQPPHVARLPAYLLPYLILSATTQYACQTSAAVAAPSSRQ
ncbi:hypothetical protein BS50DRAFT_69599 [Corynespora cassiicola Philippines]|uniref:Uncharacterized protein n=1 Tax=Corynespora cassiicola Philippines TaxID=1448308 RepID=A0A2T2NFY0_CORCC|nr:hypothetical protein BS50DRAFT_69599 [Corynespora cassiicola Philippines]